MQRTQRASVEDLDLLCLISRSMSRGIDARSAVEIAVRQSVARLGGDGGVVALIGEDGVFTPTLTVGYPPGLVAMFPRLTFESGTPLTDAARLREGIWVPSVADAMERFPGFITGTPMSQAWAAVPLMNGLDAMGSLGVSFTDPRTFTEGDQLFLTLLAELTSMVLARHLVDDAEPVDADEQLERQRRTVRKLEYVVGARVLMSTLQVNGVAAQADLDPQHRNRLLRAVEQLELLALDVRSMLAEFGDESALAEVDDVTTLDLRRFGID